MGYSLQNRLTYISTLIKKKKNLKEYCHQVKLLYHFRVDIFNILIFSRGIISFNIYLVHVFNKNLKDKT